MNYFWHQIFKSIDMYNKTMSITYHDNKIQLIYSYPDDAEKTFEKIDKHSEFHNASRIDMIIDSRAITPKFCDDIEYVFKKVPKIDKVALRFNNVTYPGAHNTITRLLHIFDDIDMLYLDTTSTYRGTSPNYNIIKTFLAKASTKKLLLDKYFNITNELVNIINNNNAIKSIELTFNMRYIDFLDTDPVLKIDAINIIDFFTTVTEHHLEKIFQFVPNLKKIYFNGKRINTGVFGMYAFEKIINFVISKPQFNKLHFRNCILDDTDIYYACDKLLEYNISSIMFIDYHGYKNKTIHSIAVLIKNNIYLKTVSISNIKSTDALLRIVESLANTNIIKFIATSVFLFFVSSAAETDFKNKIIDILSENYVLTNICIKYGQFSEVTVDTSSIVNRNIELAQKRRFTKTKAVVSVD